MDVIGEKVLNNFSNNPQYVANQDVCYCGKCSPNTPRGTCGKDLEIGEVTCCSSGHIDWCPKQPLCAKTNLSLCGNDELNRYAVGPTWRETSKQLCRYAIPSSEISLSLLDSWRQEHGEDSSYNSVLVPEFCSQRSTNCPSGADGFTPDTCSRFLSQDSAGDFCRSWMGNKDIVKENYCSGIYSRECSCIRRFDDEDYRAIEKHVNIPASCWYIPCMEENTLKTSGLMGVNCPEDTQQQVNEAAKKEGISSNRIISQKSGSSNGFSWTPIMVIIVISFFIIIIVIVILIS